MVASQIFWRRTCALVVDKDLLSSQEASRDYSLGMVKPTFTESLFTFQSSKYAMDEIIISILILEMIRPTSNSKPSTKSTIHWHTYANTVTVIGYGLPGILA